MHIDLIFLNRFCSANQVSGVSVQVSGKVDAIAYPQSALGGTPETLHSKEE
jgi:hypothetical protein